MITPVTLFLALFFKLVTFFVILIVMSFAVRLAFGFMAMLWDSIFNLASSSHRFVNKKPLRDDHS